MFRYSVRELAEIWQLPAFPINNDQVITEVVYDSRQIVSSSHALFVALKGSQRDGHDFVLAAYSEGVRIFLIQKKERHRFQSLQDAVLFSVEDPLTALQHWAKMHRQKFHIPVIGITGSNGKTIVKEWLSELLKNDFILYKSPRSFNSQLGVALSILGINKTHQLAIIEAGISKVGDMESLHQMIQPNMVILTHLGDAHDDGFASRSEKAQEKLKLVEGADVVVYPKDQSEWGTEIKRWQAKQPLTKWITWGYHERSHFKLTNVVKGNPESTLYFTYRSTEHQLVIPFKDEASISNAMTCFTALTALERWDSDHVVRFKELHSIENRMSIEKGRRQNILINDSYSHDFESFQIALSVLQEQSATQKRCAIISPIVHHAADLEKLQLLLNQFGVSQVFWIGVVHVPSKQELTQTCFETTQQLLQSDVLNTIASSAVLIKGARIYRLERVVEVLKQQLHHTVLEINLDAIRYNFRLFRSRFPKPIKLMVMVKAAGYGSGQYEVAKWLETHGVDYLGVAYADEGITLRNAGVQIPIMVMNTDGKGLQQCVAYGLEPVIYHKSGLEEWVSLPGSRHIGVHMELDTGMHRLGFHPNTDWSFLQHFHSKVLINSVFTHLSASEDALYDAFTHEQASVFQNSVSKIRVHWGGDFMTHILNTSGMVRFPEYAFNMVRLGIGLYGIETPIDEALKPAISLHTTVTQIHHVGAGLGIGYGQLDAVDYDRNIATIAIGYADGLLRKYGRGRWGAFINGKRVPFVGNICMDMAMLDVTNIICNIGDKVEIFGTNMPIKEMARQGETISYEILTTISQRVPRIFVGEY